MCYYSVLLGSGIVPKIIENQFIRFHAIDLSENESVIDYLKNTNTKFILHIDKEQFERIASNRATSIFSKNDEYIARYNCNNLKTINGVELTDEKEEIIGSFVIKDNQIVYLPDGRYFNYEPDIRGKFGITYYTTMTMVDLLENSITTKKAEHSDFKYLIYMGVNCCNTPKFYTTTKENLLMYATDRSKGIELVKEIQNKR